MEPGKNQASGIDVISAIQVLIDQRKSDQIVITHQGSARIWPQLAQHRLDFHYNPSTMGGAVPLGLGLALAQSQREILVLSGDGALLMNLGSLVTVVGAAVTNLTVVVLNNGLYEVTGGQKTPGVENSIDFAGLASTAGFPTAVEFRDFAKWQAASASVLAAPGPRFVSLVVSPTPREYLRFTTPPLGLQIQRLQEAISFAADH